MRYKYKVGKIHIALMMLLWLFVSCADKEEIAGTEPSADMPLTVNIGAVMAAPAASDIEKINSIRIILLDEQGRIKANDFANINPTAPEALDYSRQFSASAGNYHVYVIANEASVTDFFFENRFSSADQGSLSAELDKFVIGRNGFEEFINAIYFEPDFSKPILLSCDYDLVMADEPQTFNLYLVNVGTKFEVELANYRNDQVEITNIRLDKVADCHFLMARIDEESRYKDDIYWIDWLKDVVEETNNYPDINNSYDSNDFINEKWGWLTDYSIPSNANYSSVDFLAATGSVKVESGTFIKGEDPEPGEASIGPFYYPESKYIPDDASAQQYKIEFEIKISDTETKKIQKDLGNIKTLFRDTNVRLHVEMNQAYEEIYVEIMKWKERDKVYGTISPE